MLIDKMENRILVGIAAFVGVMILVGWVAINENARMASFERQYLARSIERGAELFAANCSTCHGVDGRGLAGRGPALNSPHLFGYDYFAEVDAQIAALEDEEAALNAELEGYRDELISPDITDERRAEILARREEITARISGEEGIRAQLADLREQRNTIGDQLQPAIDAGYPLQFTADGVEYLDTNIDGSPDGPSRLSQVSWGGTLYNFVFTTLVHGRPTSISYWGGNQMAAWAQTAGGPLRNDQIDDLTNYILNWDKSNDWTIEDAILVQQYAIVPGEGGTAEASAEPVGNDVDAIVQTITDDGITGDPMRGQQLYNGGERSQLGQRLSCSGCHGVGQGPATEETWDAVVNERLSLDQFAGYSAEQYIIESIVRPGEYIVDGWGASMPGNYGTQLSVQDIADITVYLRSYSGTDHPESFLQEGSGGGDAEEEADTEEAEEGDDA